MALSANGMGDGIADAMIALIGNLDAAAQERVRDGCRAIAKGIVDHITAHATVTITVSAGGLQRDPVSPNAATLAPLSPVTLAGSIV